SGGAANTASGKATGPVIAPSTAAVSPTSPARRRSRRTVPPGDRRGLVRLHPARVSAPPRSRPRRLASAAARWPRSRPAGAGGRQVPRLGVAGPVRLPRPPRLAGEVGLAHGSSFFTVIVPRSCVSPGFSGGSSWAHLPSFLVPTWRKFRAPGTRHSQTNSPLASVFFRPEPPINVRAKLAYHRMRELP